MGCPVGIGPEIILRFLAEPPASDFQPVVLGDEGILIRCASELGIAAHVSRWRPGEEIKPDAVNVLALSELDSGLAWGEPNRETGRAMGRYIEEAVRLIRDGQVAGMTTCPIAKAALQAGGYDFPVRHRAESVLYDWKTARPEPARIHR